MRPRGWAATDVGRRRDHNEDSYLCNNELGLYAVADGMGGHFGGERASRMAVEALEDQIGSQLAEAVRAADAGGGEPAGGAGANPIAAVMRAAVAKAAKAIYDEAQKSASHTGMGTTLTAALFHADHVTICHVGDSRAYLYRDGRARQLTEDHSWIQEQIRAGLITEEDALVSRFRNIITRSVGFEPQVEPDLLTLPVEPGDCFLLCSDGLSNHVNVAEIERVLTSEFYGNAGPTFVEMANDRGGEDNITCVVAYLGNIGK